MSRRLILPLLLALAATASAWEGPLPPPDRKPILQFQPDGPAAAVNAVAFHPKTGDLYTAGLDKGVRGYKRGDAGYKLDRTWRVPVGPGNAGCLNAVAISDDGAWLAVGGRAPIRDEAGFRQEGIVISVANLPPL